MTLLAVLLAGCGFHLRGSAGGAVVLPPLAVQASASVELHVRSTVPSAATEAALVERSAVGAGMTATVTSALVDPAPLLHVS